MRHTHWLATLPWPVHDPAPRPSASWVFTWQCWQLDVNEQTPGTQSLTDRSLKEAVSQRCMMGCGPFAASARRRRCERLVWLAGWRSGGECLRSSLPGLWRSCCRFLRKACHFFFLSFFSSCLSAVFSASTCEESVPGDPAVKPLKRQLGFIWWKVREKSWERFQD